MLEWVSGGSVINNAYRVYFLFFVFLVFEVWKFGGVSRGRICGCNTQHVTVYYPPCVSVCLGFFYLIFFCYKNVIQFFFLVLVLLSFIHYFIHLFIHSFGFYWNYCDGLPRSYELLSASVERFGFSCMRDFNKSHFVYFLWDLLDFYHHLRSFVAILRSLKFTHFG